MNKVIIVPNSTKDKDLLLTKGICDRLVALGIKYFIYGEYSESDGAVKLCDSPDDADMIIVVGGDGSMIDASCMACALDIPILGVNLGKVGYLTELEPDELNSIERLKDGNYNVEERMLLSVEHISSDGSISASQRLAVNDVVISHENYLGISDFRVENGRGDSLRYRADGVIVSTPLGSTAYSLSAGGPIIAHSLDVITVTPVCPHSFFNRAIVYDPSETVSVYNLKKDPLNISIDGRLFASLSENEICRIKRSDTRLKVVSFNENNMFSTLFKKIRDLEE